MEHQIPLRIHYLNRDELKKSKNQITKKSKVFHPYYLMQHELFAKHRPIMFGGGALSFHHRSMHCKNIWNRDIDDLDFYVTDKEAFDEFTAKRFIYDKGNEHEKMINFYQKMDNDFYIKITIFYRPQWKNKRYQTVMCVRVLTLNELKNMKKVESYYGKDFSVYQRKNSPTKYYARNSKHNQDISDVELINYLLPKKSK